MDYVTIEVPNENDSFCSVTLADQPVLLRFSWNDRAAFWTFGVYDTDRNPLVQGVKIVPQIPLALTAATRGLPFGAFGVQSLLAKIGREDFQNGNAVFVFMPVDAPRTEVEETEEEG